MFKLFGNKKKKQKSSKKSASSLKKRRSQRLKQQKSQKPRAKEFVDYRLLFLVAGMLFFGLLMIYSASAVVAFHSKGTTFHFFARQLLWISVGSLAAFIAYKFPLELVSKYSLHLLITAIAGLIMVLIFGEEINGARRWIYISDFSLQPSEVAKLAFVIYLAAWLSRKRPNFRKLESMVRYNLLYELLPFILWLIMISGLVMLQPDLDTTVIIAFTALTVYYVSGRDRIHTIGTTLIVGATGFLGVVAAILAPYRLRRVQVYIEFITTGSFTLEQKRNEAFQVWNGLLAIANGGLLGVGYGESTQKLFYLQETAWTDSIFAVIAEEFGLVGSIAIIVAFLYFMSVGVDISLRARDKFSSLLAVGITTWITLQAFLNIGANLALVPFGGIPLPFLSYGGSNTIVVMVGVGLLLNVAKSG